MVKFSDAQIHGPCRLSCKPGFLPLWGDKRPGCQYFAKKLRNWRDFELIFAWIWQDFVTIFTEDLFFTLFILKFFWTTEKKFLLFPWKFSKFLLGFWPNFAWSKKIWQAYCRSIIEYGSVFSSLWPNLFLTIHGSPFRNLRVWILNTPYLIDMKSQHCSSFDSSTTAQVSRFQRSNTLCFFFIFNGELQILVVVCVTQSVPPYYMQVLKMCMHTFVQTHFKFGTSLVSRQIRCFYGSVRAHWEFMWFVRRT